MYFIVLLCYTFMVYIQRSYTESVIDIGDELVQRCGIINERRTTPHDMQQLKDRFTKRYTGKLSFMGEYPIGVTACQLDPLPPIQNMYGWVPVAVGPYDFISSIMCGSCLKISPRYETKRSGFSYDADKTYFATVVDECSHCNIGDIRMYKDGDGIHDVIYEAIECPQLTGSNGLLRVKINNCADRKMEIQLKNTRLPIVAMEMFQDDAWKCLDRTENNFYSLPLPKNNIYSFPMKARATSVTGELLGFTVESPSEQTIPAQFSSMNSMNLNFLPKLKCFVQFEVEEKTNKLTDDFLSHVGNGKSKEHKRNNFKEFNVLNGKFAETNLSNEAVRKLMEKSVSKEIEYQSVEEKSNNKSEYISRQNSTHNNATFRQINELNFKRRAKLNSSFCSRRMDGQYPYPDNCYSFVICTNGLPVIKECPSGLLFNSKETVCDWPINVKCFSGEFIKKLHLANDDDIFTKRFLGLK